MQDRFARYDRARTKRQRLWLKATGASLVVVTPTDRSRSRLSPFVPAPTIAWRSGFTMIELCAALAILGGLLTILAPLLWQLTQERQRIVQDRLALELVQNTLEDWTTRSLTALNPGETVTPLAAEYLRTLPAGRLVTRIQPDASIPHAVQLDVAVHWSLGEQRPLREIRLRGWSFTSADPFTGADVGQAAAPDTSAAGSADSGSPPASAADRSQTNSTVDVRAESP